MNQQAMTETILAAKKKLGLTHVVKVPDPKGGPCRHHDEREVLAVQEVVIAA
jgi:hypothetical protein